MLYILGGAARAGKTTIANRFVTKNAIPYLSTDYLMEALEIGSPQLGVNFHLPYLQRGEKFWVFLKPMLSIIHLENPSYLVEGDPILPKFIAEFIKEHKNIKVTFLGYANTSTEKKLKQIREKHSGSYDWTNKISDEKLIESIKYNIDYSKYLQAECEKLELPYFDTSNNFEETLDEAYRYLNDRDKLSISVHP